MNARYNVVIVGQTGVGKSTLINYLYGKKVAETGVGKPVTKNGFHPIDFEINGLPICLFDSWGLEVGSYDKWMQDLDKEFKERGVNESADKWFHSVFYCIQAGGSRIQKCDITIIKKFIAENYKVSVILTKCDQVDVDVEEALKNELQTQINGLSVISVCSEEKRTRTGFTEKFGKEGLELQAFNDFFDSLILRLPLRCKSVMEQTLNTWVSKAKAKARDGIGFGGMNTDVVEYEIKNSAKELAEKIQDLVNTEIENTFQMYDTFSSHLGYPPYENKKINENFDFKSASESFWGDDWKDVILTVALLPLAVIFLAFEKNSVIEKIEENIYSYEKKFKKLIEQEVDDVTKMLRSLKLKVTE